MTIQAFQTQATYTSRLSHMIMSMSKISNLHLQRLCAPKHNHPCSRRARRRLSPSSRRSRSPNVTTSCALSPGLCTGASATDMEVRKPGPFTRSSARARSIVIPEPMTLSDSEDDIRFVARQVRLVPYGASKSPAASIQFQQEQMSQDVPTMVENVSFPTSPNNSVPPRSSPVLPPLSIQVRSKLDTKANRITVFFFSGRFHRHRRGTSSPFHGRGICYD